MARMITSKDLGQIHTENETTFFHLSKIQSAQHLEKRFIAKNEILPI